MSKKTENMEIFIPREKIQEVIKNLADRINKDYKDTKEVVLVGVMNGSFLFMADLVRHLTLEDMRVTFIKLSSYGSSTETSGKVKTMVGLELDCKGRNILVIEDIVDTGITFNSIREQFEGLGVESIKFVSLLDKPSRRKIDVKVDYIGMQIEDKYVVGYGFDVDSRYRELPDIYHYLG